MVGWGWGFCEPRDSHMLGKCSFWTTPWPQTCFQKLLTQPEHQQCVLKGRVSSSSPSGPPAPQHENNTPKDTWSLNSGIIVICLKGNSLL